MTIPNDILTMTGDNNDDDDDDLAIATCDLLDLGTSLPLAPSVRIQCCFALSHRTHFQMCSLMCTYIVAIYEKWHID